MLAKHFGPVGVIGLQLAGPGQQAFRELQLARFRGAGGEHHAAVLAEDSSGCAHQKGIVGLFQGPAGLGGEGAGCLGRAAAEREAGVAQAADAEHRHRVQIAELSVETVGSRRKPCFPPAQNLLGPGLVMDLVVLGGLREDQGISRGLFEILHPEGEAPPGLDGSGRSDLRTADEVVIAQQSVAGDQFVLVRGQTRLELLDGLVAQGADF